MYNRGPILITGGTGFIGSYLAKHLLEQGERVVLFDRNPDPLVREGVSGPRRVAGFFAPADFDHIKKEGRLTFVQGDLTLLPHVLAVFDQFEPKSVYHLGALLSAGAEANPTQGFQVDLVGTWHVLEAARLYREYKRGTEPVKVIFPSTIASFGDFIAPGAKVPNEAVQWPTTIYGTSKVAAERLGDYYSRKPREWVDFRAVRFPSVIGAARGGGGTTAYSTLMVQEPLRKRNYVAYVGADTRLDILYVKDAIKALTLVHDADPASLVANVDGETVTRRVYNIAGIRSADQAATAAEIQAAVSHVKPDAGQITFEPNPGLVNIVHSFGILDDTVARQQLKWKGDYLDLITAITDFQQEIKAYPDRIQALELSG